MDNKNVIFFFCLFIGFGTTNTNTNLFGTQQNASTNLFGTSTATSAFGQSNKPAGFGFGATSGTNLFGQPQQSTQQTTPFGQSSTTGNTNLFGTTPGMSVIFNRIIHDKKNLLFYYFYFVYSRFW